ncbi:hypothetical protein BRYFOR_07424 [Marvinbryantia formatexigens DSM 14469]|uniref:Uncharacterized protein n=1 Tax=Marvinbryantia formatexigens DSM 14469 TaxID=478749 RepID=C6LFM1_9FIRM|nr:hypothetical protein BRYFOR_07424 [Marvinbryantia formatexigens DSM 14469]
MWLRCFLRKLSDGKLRTELMKAGDFLRGKRIQKGAGKFCIIQGDETAEPLCGYFRMNDHVSDFHKIVTSFIFGIFSF